MPRVFFKGDESFGETEFSPANGVAIDNAGGSATTLYENAARLFRLRDSRAAGIIESKELA